MNAVLPFRPHPAPAAPDAGADVALRLTRLEAQALYRLAREGRPWLDVAHPAHATRVAAFSALKILKAALGQNPKESA